MRKFLLPTAVIALLGGAAAGGAMTYFWLTRHSIEDHSAGEAAHVEPDAQKDAHAHDSHAKEGAHEGHPKEGAHDEHAEGKVVLTPDAMSTFGVEVAVAGPGKLERTLRLPGEIVLNADKVAHVVPRVAGVIREVLKNVGDKVEAGDVIAVLDSRELAEAKSADLAAEARLRLAETNFKRLEGLLQKKIAPEQEYYEAKQKLEEAQIQHRETEAKLHALGLRHEEVVAVSNQTNGRLSRLEIKAPFTGTIVDKHAALGEVHDSSSDMFVVADLSTVWVEISVYPKDVSHIRSGSKLRLTAPGPDGQPVTTEAAISYVSPVIREATRTGTARAVMPNAKGLWKPGSFVTAEVILAEDDVPLLVPNTAVQVMENQSVLFVEEEGGFEKRVVRLGRSSDTHSEVLSGMKPGDRYVIKGGFILKAELMKGSGGHEH